MDAPSRSGGDVAGDCSFQVEVGVTAPAVAVVAATPVARPATTRQQTNRKRIMTHPGRDLPGRPDVDDRSLSFTATIPPSPPLLGSAVAPVTFNHRHYLWEHSCSDS